MVRDRDVNGARRSVSVRRQLLPGCGRSRPSAGLDVMNALEGVHVRTESVALHKRAARVIACSALAAALGGASAGCAQEARASASTAEPIQEAVAAPSSKLGLVLDGQFVGFPASAAGGDVFA